MNQEGAILQHMKDHGAINPLMALERYGCMRLAARIADLRHRGYKIETVIKKSNDKFYAEYHLDGA